MSGAEAEQVCDVYVRYGWRGRYTLVNDEVPVDLAYAQVAILRADPSIDWAYCTEPRDPPPREGVA